MKIKNILKPFGFILLSTMTLLMFGCGKEYEVNCVGPIEWEVQNNSKNNIQYTINGASCYIFSNGKPGTIEFTTNIYNTKGFKNTNISTIGIGWRNEQGAQEWFYEYPFENFTSEWVDIIIEKESIIFEFKELNGNEPPSIFNVQVNFSANSSWFEIKWDVD